MRQHTFWRCRDCNSYYKTGIVDGNEVIIDVVIWRAYFSGSGETFKVILYCKNCGEEKGALYIPSGGSISSAYEGRVEILTTYVDEAPSLLSEE